MATPYSVIEQKFLAKISDRFLLTMEVLDLQLTIDNYREGAEVTFKKCAKLLDKNDISNQYNQTLTNEEIEVLSDAMVIEWSYPTVNRIDLLKERMTTNDYKLFSQANHIDSILDFVKMTEIRVKRKITSYTWTNATILGGLKP